MKHKTTKLDIKWKLEDIIARYVLEPSMKAVYVEGTRDRSILQWFFYKKGKSDVYVYTIDTVDVPFDLIQEMNLNTFSNKNALIALSEKLSMYFNGNRIRVKCIADADYDRYLERCRNNYILEYTDYTSMEMYFFNEPFLKKVFDLVINGRSVSPANLLVEMSKVLQRFFLMRLANEKLGWNMDWLKNYSRYISWNKDSIQFDENKFLTSYLNKGKRIKDKDKFQSVMNKLRVQFDSDPRHNIRGHDFTSLFLLAAKKKLKSKAVIKDEMTFERVLCGCMELEFVENQRLFVNLAAL